MNAMAHSEVPVWPRNATSKPGIPMLLSHAPTPMSGFIKFRQIAAATTLGRM